MGSTINDLTGWLAKLLLLASLAGLVRPLLLALHVCLVAHTYQTAQQIQFISYSLSLTELTTIETKLFFALNC